MISNDKYTIETSLSSQGYKALLTTNDGVYQVTSGWCKDRFEIYEKLIEILAEEYWLPTHKDPRV
jgi:hypothetical protein